MSKTNELSNLRDEFTRHKKEMSEYIETFEDLRDKYKNDIIRASTESKQIASSNAAIIYKSIDKMNSLVKQTDEFFKDCNAKFKSQDKAIKQLREDMEKSIQEIKDGILKNQREQATRNLKFVSDIEKGKEDHLSLNKGVASTVDELKKRVSAKKSWFSCTGRSAAKSQNSRSGSDASGGGRKRKTVRRSRLRRRN
jgi:hypothetical protein